MKKLILLLISLLVISCDNTDKNKKIITDGEWIEEITVYSKENIKDTSLYKLRIKFCENGEMIIDKYKIAPNKYKIQGNRFLFTKNDIISSTYNIISASINEIILDSINSKNDIKIIFKKVPSLPVKPYDQILINLNTICDIGTIEKLNDGRLFIMFNPYKYENNSIVYYKPNQIEPQIKGCVDKALKILPKKEVLNEYSEWEHNIYNYYEWETIEFKLTMQNDFIYDKDGKDYLKVRIFITEK